MTGPQLTTIDTLIDRYEALLIDAFGVLLTSEGLLPGAAALVNRLNALGKPWVILTNDASRPPETSLSWYLDLGLDVRPDQIVSSGSLLVPHFARLGLVGAPTICLGPEGSRRYVERAGGALVDFDDDSAEVVVAGDDAGFPFLEGVEATLSTLCRRADAGLTTHLVLPNPDLIYPRGPGRFGLTSGSIALLLEAALELRYPDRPELRFERLGKPHAPIYQAAVERVGTRDALMIGDQLHTDILGAAAFGLDSALVATGLARSTSAEALGADTQGGLWRASIDKALGGGKVVSPTWLLDGLT